MSDRFMTNFLPKKLNRVLSLLEKWSWAPCLCFGVIGDWPGARQEKVGAHPPCLRQQQQWQNN